MIITPRNRITISAGYGAQEVGYVDTLYEICDAEFSSRADVHNSFGSARGEASWARYYLLHEVRKIAIREDLYMSFHMAYVIAQRIAKDWFEQKETV